MTSENPTDRDDADEFQRLQRQIAGLEEALTRARSMRHAEDPRAGMAAMFGAIYDQSSHLGGILSPEGILLNANRTACELAGTDLSQVVGRPLWETPWWTHSAEEQEKLRNGILRAAQGESVQFESTHLAFDGTLHFVDFSLKPARDESGRPFCLIAEGRDVTAEKRAGEERRETESMLRSVFRATPIGITFNIARVIIGANDSMCELMGSTEQQLVGKSARMFYDSQDEYERVGRELYGEISQKGRTNVETRFLKSDGTTLFVMLTAALLRAEDPTAGFVVTVQDITQRKRGEDALRESEDRFRRMMEESPFSIQVLSPAGEVLEMNEACEKLWGIRKESLRGYSLLRDRELERLGLMPFVRKAFAGEQVRTPVVEYDAAAIFGGGLRKVVQATFYPIRRSNGEVRQIILVHLDLTERVRAEEETNKLQEQLQQAMKMEAVGRLAGGIAHDFNNLLTTIAGNAELARLDTAPTGPLAQRLAEISKAAESAASLTSQLLTFSRRQIIEPKSLNLNDLVSHFQMMLTRLIGEDVELQIDLGQPLGSVKVDPGQFEQVLVNLAVNARDAMPDGGRLLIQTRDVGLDAVRGERHPQAQPGEYVLLLVSDTGHGMSNEVKERIFEPFFTTKPTGKGTGLGLATIFGIVKQAGGFIDVDSEVGQGSTFRIYLPKVETAPMTLVAAEATTETATGGETVLIVEDNPSVRGLAHSFLRKLGYTVLLASSGEDAVRFAEKHRARIDLLLTDVVMPGMNGRKLAEHMRVLHPETKVLYTSGYTDDVIVHHGVLDKNLHFIGKPYSLKELSGKIREALKSGPGT